MESVLEKGNRRNEREGVRAKENSRGIARARKNTVKSVRATEAEKDIERDFLKAEYPPREQDEKRAPDIHSAPHPNTHPPPPAFLPSPPSPTMASC